VNISFDVEGTSPIEIRSVSAHAHPDAIYRQFENGIVLANPSRAEYTFDLAKLAPGQKFKRLQGTRLQDVKTNNGLPIQGPRITLGERDAIFLMKQ